MSVCVAACPRTQLALELSQCSRKGDGPPIGSRWGELDQEKRKGGASVCKCRALTTGPGTEVLLGGCGGAIAALSRHTSLPSPPDPLLSYPSSSLLILLLPIGTRWCDL